MKTFNSMDLFAPLKRTLAEQNYEQPTPIQAQTIPSAIDGQDILGCAQTGTGKTAAFALPILDYLGREKPRSEPNRPIALVMAPTRELAIQISESFRVYGKYIHFRHALVYGGVPQGRQVDAIRRGAHVLIATPGRLLDLMEQRHVDLRSVEIFVLDEADRMLDMGFLPDLKKIIARLPSKRQSLFFSATMPPKIRELSSQLLFNPVSVSVNRDKPNVEKIEQTVTMIERGHKFASLRDVLSEESVHRTIVFTRTKHGANALARKLERVGIGSAAIHGDKSQNARQRALQAFRQNKVTVLVATDVAARGIDIDGVTHVINFDMPVEPEIYVHRIGRTGRAGADGTAISFCTPDERSELRAIEKLIGKPLPVDNRKAPFELNNAPTKREAPRKSTRGKKNGSRSKATQGPQRPFARRKKSQRPSGRSKQRAASVA